MTFPRPDTAEATRGSWRHVPTGSCYFHASEAHANLAAKEELLLRSFRIEIQDELGKGPQNCLSTRGWAPDYRSGSWLMKSEVTLEKVSRNRCMPALGSLSRWNSSFSFESGGSNTIYSIAALDERVRLTRAVSSVTNFDYWIRNNRSRN
jgi:hypothetical protein